MFFNDLKNSSNFHLHFQGNEKKVYDFIVRHFLATCSQDAQGQETTVEIKIAEEKVKFFLSFYDFIFKSSFEARRFFAAD